MTYSVQAFTTKDAATIRDDILRTYKNGLIQQWIAQGISNYPQPQVGPGSDPYIWATAIANEIVVTNANIQVTADQLMPDTATGTYLDRLLAAYGLSRRTASTSAGFITLDCSQTTLLVTGAQLVDASGLRYQVSVGGTYSAGSIVPISSVDTGTAVNLAAGTVLKTSGSWPYCNSQQVVYTGGLTGGAPAEDDATARNRLLARLQNAPGSGNWSQVTGFAEASTPIVQKAFCYPAVNGPSTCHVAVVGYASSVSKNRDVATTVLSGTVNPYVLGQMPEYVETVVTTVQNQAVDVGFGMTLPLATTAQPAGPGGGWLDGTPWPTPNAITGWANVTAVTSSTNFTVNTVPSPQAGVSRIAMLDSTNWQLYTAKVLTVSGSSGAWVITTDQPFPNIATILANGGSGPIIFPQSVNQQTYINAILAQFAAMGPGEKTSSTGVLSRGYRHPLPVQSWPYTIGAQMLKALTNSGSEVLFTSVYGASTQVPSVPGSVAQAPYILVPRNIGLYQV